MFLYHGTASYLVEPICAQSFDPRLHGTHETLYGKGSYFAKNASYSHGYSLPDQDGYFYMFLAQVLVGQYVKVGFQNKRNFQDTYWLSYIHVNSCDWPGPSVNLLLES